MGRAAGWGRSHAHACEHGPQRSLRAVSVRAPARGVGLASRLHLCRLQGRACACGCECELGDERAWACRVSVPVARECESPACCAPGCGVGGGEEAPGTWSGPPGGRPRAPSGVTTQRASGRPTPLPARPGAPGSLTFTSHRKGGPPGGGSQERGRPGSGGGRASRRRCRAPCLGKAETREDSQSGCARRPARPAQLWPPRPTPRPRETGTPSPRVRPRARAWGAPAVCLGVSGSWPRPLAAGPVACPTDTRFPVWMLKSTATVPAGPLSPARRRPSPPCPHPSFLLCCLRLVSS